MLNECHVIPLPFYRIGRTGNRITLYGQQFNHFMNVYAIFDRGVTFHFTNQLVNKATLHMNRLSYLALSAIAQGMVVTSLHTMV